MKKFILTSLMLVSTLLLVACNEQLPASTLETFQWELSEALPLYINQDTTLPTLDNAEVTWRYKNQDIQENVFVYQAPFIDKTITLEATVTFQGKSGQLLFPVLLVSEDSPRLIHQMYFTLPVNPNTITKETYVNGSVRIEGEINGVLQERLGLTDVQIRGRGNSTWEMPKKPYRLRFASDTSVLGMPAARNYVLLAEYADKSLIRNALTHKISALSTHIEHTLSTRFVEVYFNNDYHGLYKLTEHIEVHPNKLHVPTDLTSLDAGFFIELDQRLFQDSLELDREWFTVAGIPYEVKSPNPTGANYTLAHTAYIKNYIRDMEQALIHKTGYEAYMDVDNFVDFFFIHELVKNVDVGWSSVFAYKQQGDVLKMGPLWDFDLSLGNADYIDYSYENFYGFAENKNRWFHLMMQVPEIRAKFRDRVVNFYLHELEIISPVFAEYKTHLALPAEKNFAKWQILGIYVWPNPPLMVDIMHHSGQVDYVSEYLINRALWLYEAVMVPNFVEGQS